MARRAKRDVPSEAPPFFAQRTAANWLQSNAPPEDLIWELFSLRGLTVAVTIMILAVAAQAALPPDDDVASAEEFASDVFSLP
jgi:hypothetical protein